MTTDFEYDTAMGDCAVEQKTQVNTGPLGTSEAMPWASGGLKIGSLFSGIGGLELGLEAAGVGRTIWQVEQDDFCRQILAKHWPSVDRTFTDVRAASTTNLCPVDILCGGFPCQDVSGAGKGAGLAGERSGLWFEYHRLVRELQPTAVVVENVASGARRWLPTVRRMLEAIGYRTRAIAVAASDCGAPHLRRRIFVLGLADTHGSAVREQPGRVCGTSRRKETVGRCAREAVGHTQSAGCEFMRSPAESDRAGQTGLAERGLGRVPDGAADRLDIPDWWPFGQGQAQDQKEPPRTIRKGTDPYRCKRLKALGNAVVPHCGYVAGRALVEWMETIK